MNYEMELAIVVLVSLAIGAGAFVGARRVGGGPGVKKTLRIAGVALALLTAYVFQPLPEMPAWEEPATEQERKARDFAHAIVLPDAVPKPVPFNFALARLKALVPGLPDVSEQYFKHLCDTEAGQYIFKTAENVDGFLQMRPRRIYTDIEQMDPYLIESAVGISASSSQRYKASVPRNGGPIYFVQPMSGQYQYLEQPAASVDGFDFFYRGPQVINSESSGVTASFDSKTQRPVEVDFVVNQSVGAIPRSKYAYTWRGLKRANDRAYWISGGDLIVIDLQSNEVLAVYREFKMGQGKYVRWDTSRWCEKAQPDYDHLFVPKVLKPDPRVNAHVKAR